MCLFTAALQAAVATLARSFKEAQTYMGVLILGPMLPGIMSALYPIGKAAMELRHPDARALRSSHRRPWRTRPQLDRVSHVGRYLPARQRDSHSNHDRTVQERTHHSWTVSRSGLGIRDPGFGIRDSGFGIRGSGLEFVLAGFRQASEPGREAPDSLDLTTSCRSKPIRRARTASISVNCVCFRLKNPLRESCVQWERADDHFVSRSRGVATGNVVCRGYLCADEFLPSRGTLWPDFAAPSSRGKRSISSRRRTPTRHARLSQLRNQSPGLAR